MHLFSTLLLLVACLNASAANPTELNVDDVQSLFYQIIALLGLSLIIYLYVNFRNNSKKQAQRKESINISHEARNIAGNLQQLVNLIPYPACISNETQKVIYFNTLYANLLPLRPTETAPYWDKQLKIDYRQINMANTDDVVATSEDNRRYKIAIRPIQFSEVNIQLYTVIVEDRTHQDTPKDEGYQLKETITNANLPIILVDHQYKVTNFNHHAVSLLKSDSQSLFQKPVTSLFNKDEHDAILGLFDSGRNTNISNSFHIVVPDTSTLPVEVYRVPISDSGKKISLLIIIDISERRKMENAALRAMQRAEESDRLKSSFLANMSHEVRTPLNSIMGFTELMCDEQLSTNERKEFHNIVKTSSNELLRLLSDIMEFSKIESGLIKLDIANTYAHEIVKELSEYVNGSLASHPAIQFNVEEPIGFDIPVISTDRNRVVQTLRQLIDNAMKFTYSGNVRLSYQYRPDNSVEFIVSDSGIGIPKEKIPSIFHKFRQANDDNSRDFGGAGLGLSICKHLANALGGFLWVSSVEKVGSEFHFIIPANGEKMQSFRLPNTIIYYSKHPKQIPFKLDETKVLSLFQFAALLNVPLAYNVSVMLLDTSLTDNEMATLLAIPQVKKASIILYNESVSEILYSPIDKETNSLLSGQNQLQKYITRCAERQLAD